MSLCVALSTRDSIYISADSRVSLHVNDQAYRWRDDYKKIEKIDNNMVIFKAGRSKPMDIIIEKFKTIKIKDLSTYKQICIDAYNNYILEDNTDDSNVDGFIVSSIIGLFEHGLPVIYFIGEMSKFEYIKVELPKNQDIQDVILGVNCEIARKIYKNLKLDFDDITSVFQNIKKIYEAEGVAGEEIGGLLTLYKISNSGVQCLTGTIRDPDNLKDISDYLEANNMQYCLRDANTMTISARLYANQLYIGGSSLNALIDGQINGQALAASTIDDTKISSLNCSKLTAGTITASISLTAAQITSNSTINVETDMTIGDNLTLGNQIILSETNMLAGISWGSSDSGIAIYYEADAGTLHIDNPGGAVCAGDQRIDQPIVAVFG